MPAGVFLEVRFELIWLFNSVLKDCKINFAKELLSCFVPEEFTRWCQRRINHSGAVRLQRSSARIRQVAYEKV